MLVKSLKDNGKVELFTWFFTSILKLGPWIGKVSLIDSTGKVCSTEKYLGSSIGSLISLMLILDYSINEIFQIAYK